MKVCKISLMGKKGEQNSKNLYKVIGDMLKDGAHGEANNRGEAKDRGVFGQNTIERKIIMDGRNWNLWIV